MHTTAFHLAFGLALAVPAIAAADAPVPNCSVSIFGAGPAAPMELSCAIADVRRSELPPAGGGPLEVAMGSPAPHSGLLIQGSEGGASRGGQSTLALRIRIETPRFPAASRADPSVVFLTADRATERSVGDIVIADGDPKPRH